MISDKSTPKDELLTTSYFTETCKQVQNGRRVLTHRLKSIYAANEECVESFNEEVTIGKMLNHPHILRFATLSSEGNIPTALLEPLNCVTLEVFLHENPAFVSNSKEVERIIKEVEDALAYLHEKGICHLNLHPRNILLTKNGKTVKLSNSLFTYAHLTLSLKLTSNDFTAPELFDEQVVENLVPCDIYSLGKLITYLYDMSTLPYPYRKAVKQATDADPNFRPASINDFNQLVSAGKFMLNIFKGVIGTIVIFLAATLLIWLTTSTNDNEIHFIEPTANNTYVYDSISGEEYYLSDSAMAVREAAIEREKENMMKQYDHKLNEIFKKDFREKAAPVIHEIYSKKNMDSETGIFTSVSNQGMQELQGVQEELSRQYELDQISTSKVAAEVIEELTRQRMSELQNSN